MISLIILPNELFPIKMIKTLFKKLGQPLDKVILIEEPRYFTDFRFHKLKLVYHRVTMQSYEKELNRAKISTSYIDFNKVTSVTYSKLNTNKTYYFNPIDHKLNKKLERTLSKATKLDNLNFLLTPSEVESNKDIFYKNNKYSHEEFYKFQRKRLDILMKDDKPVGGKFSFDTENRLNLPPHIKIPPLPKIKKNNSYKEAVSYVDKHFPKNYGSTDEFIFPTNNITAVRWFRNFLTKRLNNFGPYEDAVSSDNHFLFHSVLSPMMNIGILPDSQVIDIAKKYYLKHKSTISLQSFEGFIRQVIGWRNYVYAVYLLEPDMYEENFLKHHNKISDKYWLGNTGITPIDTIIQNIVKYSYAHHIERLMYLGNWFLINKADPKEVHRIFMEWTVDAYDWVMVPNIMGMSQYSDHGKMMTRIYFSSSNYIDKMSNFKRTVNKDDTDINKKNWWEIWDAVYYAFIHSHKELLAKNYATARQVAHWKKKTKSEQETLLKTANKYKLL
jgi:deoxyribodipyrimidine photolyase-related protein